MALVEEKYVSSAASMGITRHDGQAVKSFYELRQCVQQMLDSKDTQKAELVRNFPLFLCITRNIINDSGSLLIQHTPGITIRFGNTGS
mmetsp:Transcript_12440/g.20641  ORF Transcript_12440/g.20641 Transcript_12440/m.20641 type:complete len:88 (-) Transcript_12440:1336-1599(-)